MTTWVERTARQRSVWQVFLFVVVTAIVVSLFVLNASYWGPFIKGPTQVGAEGLDAATNAFNTLTPNPTPFVTVHGEQVANTGTQEVTTYNLIISRVSAGYYALAVGDKILIVKSEKPPTTTVTGSLDPMPYELKSALFPEDADPAQTARIYPLLLETKYRESGYIAIFWALLVEAIFGFFAFRSLSRLTGSKEHPAVTRAKAWGDLSVISSAVESELQNAVKWKAHGWTVTENYAVQKTWFRFNLLRMDNLLWAYKNATKRSVNFIPVGTAYSAMLCFSDGAAAIEGKQKQIDELLQFANARAPWAVMGYSEELAALYKNSTREFASEVLSNRKAIGR